MIIDRFPSRLRRARLLRDAGSPACSRFALPLCLLLALTGCHSATDCNDFTGNLKEDSRAYRQCVTRHALADFFGTPYHRGCDLIAQLPPGTKALDLVNPGFNYTVDNGKEAPKGSCVFVVEDGKPGTVSYYGKNLGMSDPIQGWTSVGCSGVEASRRFKTMPDYPTGYAIAYGHDASLYQTLKGQLKPNTRYTLIVEIYARGDYKAPKANELQLYLTDGENNPAQASKIEKRLTTTDPETGFAIAILSVTTHADQPETDLRLHLGFNATGNVRVNYDNVRLWAQPVE